MKIWRFAFGVFLKFEKLCSGAKNFNSILVVSQASRTMNLLRPLTDAIKNFSWSIISGPIVPKHISLLFPFSL